MARSSGATAAAAPASPPPSSNHKAQSRAKHGDDYTSDGVEDNDVFLLPLSDYWVTLAVTVLSAVVRLFRIYQPTSVVFDEVQYVGTFLPPPFASAQS